MTYIRPTYKGYRHDTTPSGRYWRYGIDLNPPRRYARIALWPILALCAVWMWAFTVESPEEHA